MPPDTTERTFRPPAGRKAFWSLATLVFAAIVVFLTPIFLEDEKSPRAAPITVGLLNLFLFFLLLRLEFLWSRLTVSERGVRLRTPVRRFDLTWEDVACVEIRALESQNAAALGVSAGIAFLPGISEIAGGLVGRAAGGAISAGTPAETVPFIRVLGRNGRPRITLVGVYDWMAADALRTVAVRREIPVRSAP